MKAISNWPEEMIKLEHADRSGTNGYIQWKGTGVCIDIHCVCGHHAHMDTECLYFFACPQCLAEYAVGDRVQLYSLAGEALESKRDKCKRPDLYSDDLKTLLADGNQEWWHHIDHDETTAHVISALRTELAKKDEWIKRLEDALLEAKFREWKLRPSDD